MISISATASNGGVYNRTATESSNRNTTDVAPANSTDASTTVTISAAAREAADRDTTVRDMDACANLFRNQWNKDFPRDVLDEATARLRDIKANGSTGASRPMGLPLLPENQKLADSFRQEMKTIHADWANATPEQVERFNLLLNLNFHLQLTGWEKPMTEADVQRELDISTAMAKLRMNDPEPPPVTDPDTSASEIADMQSGSVPKVWRQRWEEEGLRMPTDAKLSPGHSMWLDLAKAAGIGEDDFMSKLREMAGRLNGNALTRAIETFISERYVATNKA